MVVDSCQLCLQLLPCARKEKQVEGNHEVNMKREDVKTQQNAKPKGELYVSSKG